MQTKREIEAYETFRNLYESGERTDEIIYYILVLAFNNKRELPNGLINIAKASNNTQILYVVAGYYYQSGMYEDAYRANRRALFKCTSEEYKLYGQFIGIHTARPEGPVIIKRINTDTAILLKNIINEAKLIICVHPDEELSSDYLEWENSIHVFRTTAIKLGLFRKQAGDEVEFNSSQWLIEKIESIDSYLFRVAMEKLLQTGNAQAITFKTREDGGIDTEDIVRQMKKAIGDNTQEPQWLSQYKDLYSMPVPFCHCHLGDRLTYSGLISIMIKDPTVMFREVISQADVKPEGYVLSFAALIALFHIGYIPHADVVFSVTTDTLKKVIFEDTERTITEYGKDNVAVFRIINEQLQYIEATEKDKSSIIEQAVNLKDYVTMFSDMSNSDDFVLNDEAQFNIKEMLGIIDYDALLIAKKNGLTLVTAEVPLCAMCSIEGISEPFVCIADFLANTSRTWQELIGYIEKMMEYRFTIPITLNTVKFIDHSYNEGTIEEKEKIIENWQSVLNAAKDDSLYKSQLP